MQLNDVFPSKYVKSADLKGREVTVVIADVIVEKIGDDRKLVIYFQGKEKGLVTNKTNANRVALMYGEDTDNWLGKEITLFTDFVDFQGKTVEAIRIRPPARRAAPQQPQRQQQQAPDDGYETRQSGGINLMNKKPPPKDGLAEVLPDRDAMDEEVPF